jgi:hypothetical protein
MDDVDLIINARFGIQGLRCKNEKSSLIDLRIMGVMLGKRRVDDEVQHHMINETSGTCSSSLWSILLVYSWT